MHNLADPVDDPPVDDGHRRGRILRALATCMAEKGYQATTIADFTCTPNRGDPQNSLFIFNHFLTDTLPRPEQAPIVNANPFLVDRARDCMQTDGSLPNFVTVDFYDRGDLFAAVRSLNGL